LASHGAVLQEHPGTYFFCRPLYAGLSSHPVEIEFGVLRADGTLWLNTFKNYGRIEELEEFERLREKIAALETSGGIRGRCNWRLIVLDLKPKTPPACGPLSVRGKRLPDPQRVFCALAPAAVYLYDFCRALEGPKDNGLSIYPE